MSACRVALEKATQLGITMDMKLGRCTKIEELETGFVEKSEV